MEQEKVGTGNWTADWHGALTSCTVSRALPAADEAAATLSILSLARFSIFSVGMWVSSRTWHPTRHAPIRMLACRQLPLPHWAGRAAMVQTEFHNNNVVGGLMVSYGLHTQ